MKKSVRNLFVSQNLKVLISMRKKLFNGFRLKARGRTKIKNKEAATKKGCLNNREELRGLTVLQSSHMLQV